MMHQRLVTLGLALAVLATALGVVFSQHASRLSFSRLQSEHATRDALDTDWGRLQLEQSTLTTHGRVEGIARARLQMVQPASPQLMSVEH